MKLLQLDYLSRYTSRPITKGIVVMKGDVIKVTDAQAETLLSKFETDVADNERHHFIDVTEDNPKPRYDFSGEVTTELTGDGAGGLTTKVVAKAAAKAEDAETAEDKTDAAAEKPAPAAETGKTATQRPSRARK